MNNNIDLDILRTITNKFYPEEKHCRDGCLCIGKMTINNDLKIERLKCNRLHPIITCKHKSCTRFLQNIKSINEGHLSTYYCTFKHRYNGDLIRSYNKKKEELFLSEYHKLKNEKQNLSKLIKLKEQQLSDARNKLVKMIDKLIDNIND